MLHFESYIFNPFSFMSKVADKVFAETLFKQDIDLLDVWVNYPLHPLQEQEPDGDRKWISSFPLLQVFHPNYSVS